MRDRWADLRRSAAALQDAYEDLEDHGGTRALCLAWVEGTEVERVALDPIPNQVSFLLYLAEQCPEWGAAFRQAARAWQTYDHHEVILCLVRTTDGEEDGWSAVEVVAFPKPWLAAPSPHCPCGIREGEGGDHWYAGCV